MLPVYYKPAEVIGLLGEDSEEYRHKARQKGREISRATTERNLTGGLKQAAGAMWDFGRGALADLLHRQAEGTGYVLDADGFEAKTMTGRKRIGYKDVTDIRARNGDRFVVTYSGGAITIKPLAHLVAGRLRVPIGWERNGMEVPYGMLIDELAARCGVEVTWA